ncbi:hypothetical protein F5Y19DRAFT_270210 [Xylariaceae sp. FL1651]|nr:hypothetical protein F5Y19DRAFT_270210 [Xylariaceae sp. FL1651]
MVMRVASWLTLALLMNSRNTGFPLCSSVSSTNVNGLALSRKLSSFWSSSSACERACDCAEDDDGIWTNFFFPFRGYGKAELDGH